MEHLVTIPLSEYNELIKIRDEIKPAFDENKPILLKKGYYGLNTKYDCFIVIKSNDLIEGMKSTMKSKEENWRVDYGVLKKELNDLKDKIDNSPLIKAILNKKK